MTTTPNAQIPKLWLKPLNMVWVSVFSRNAKDYLHRMTTVNLKTIAVGQGQTGFFLNAQGKILAHFNLWFLSQDHFGLELDAGKEKHWEKKLLDTIEQFKFAEKIEAAAQSDQLCAWLLFETSSATPAELAAPLAGLQPLETRFLETPSSEIRVCRYATSRPEQVLVAVWGTETSLIQWLKTHYPTAQPLDPKDWERERIRALAPKADAEITEKVIPLELGLFALLSEKKGCYPGQEVIERTISIGSPARRLALFSGHGVLPTPGSEIGSSPEGKREEIGVITSVTPLSGSTSDFIGLALIRKHFAREKLPILFSTGAEGIVEKVSEQPPKQATKNEK